MAIKILNTPRQTIVAIRPVKVDTISNEQYNIPVTAIQFDKTEIDFNKVFKDTLLNGSFILKNTGKEPLILYLVSPDCLCTSVLISKKIIPVQDTAIIKLTIDTKGKFGTQILRTVVRANTEKKNHLLTMKVHIENEK